MFCGGGGGGSKSAKGGPNPLADLDRGGPRGVQIRCDTGKLNFFWLPKSQELSVR